jgi:hypothetical protein
MGNQYESGGVHYALCHSKPNGQNQTEDSQISTSSKGGRRTPLTIKQRDMDKHGKLKIVGRMRLAAQ